MISVYKLKKPQLYAFLRGIYHNKLIHRYFRGVVGEIYFLRAVQTKHLIHRGGVDIKWNGPKLLWTWSAKKRGTQRGERFVTKVFWRYLLFYLSSIRLLLMLQG